MEQNKVQSLILHFHELVLSLVRTYNTKPDDVISF